jgi:branched-chain amino acid transport system permease protein
MSMPRVVALLHVAAVGALAIFPWMGGEFYVDLVVRLMILSIFAVSLDLLVGHTGLVSFGHAAFFGLAGYVLASVTPDTGPISLWYALGCCLTVSAIAALAIGWFSVRTSGIYFIMITLAFAQMLYYFFSESSLFGGSDGIFVFFRPRITIGAIEIFDLNDPLVFYYFVLASLATSYALLATILRAPFGQVLRGIRVNEGRTRALGYATQRYKLVSFVIAGTLAGLAGFLEATHTGYVSPGHLGWHESGTALIVVILGGMGTLYGPVLGAFAFGLLQNWFQDVTEHWLLAMGVFVILVVLLMPGGIAGMARRLGNRRIGGRTPLR